MPANQPHIAGEFSGENIQLPLYNFFIALKQNGFLVTPAQIADSHTIIAQYAGGVTNETELCDYLSPLFANNEEEQVKFKELFDSNYKSGKAGLPIDGDKSLFVSHLKKHWWKYVVALAIVLLVGWGLNRPSTDAVEHEYIYLRSNYESAGKSLFEAFKLNIGDTLKVYSQSNDRQKDSINRVNLTTRFDWGDSSGIDSIAKHVYTQKGNYPLRAFVEVFYGKQFRYRDTLLETVKVCDENNSLLIERSLQADSVRIGGKVRLRAKINGRAPDTIKWSDGNQWLATGALLDTSFATEGLQEIHCVAVYDSIGSPCTIQQIINLVIYDPNKPILSATVTKAVNANAVVLPTKVKPWWFWLAGLLFAGSFTGMWLFSKWKKKAVKKEQLKLAETDKQYNELVSGFAGKKTPFDLPFRNKNALPLSEPGLNEVAWQMRRRIDDDATYLHLEKTIRRSILSAGFFQPVKVPRTHQSEYLVLIDETIINNQQVKLFEYLVELLRKQNVFIDKFYYREQPALCYNVFEPSGISLEKLNEKYPQHVLLIFGKGHQLIYPHYPVFDQAYQQLISRWKYKAVITPLTVPDWGLKEKNVLPSAIPVLPVDVYGQLVLMQYLFSGEEIDPASLAEFREEYYKVEPVDFEEIDELYDYCNHAEWAKMKAADPASNILFQWIAALALYPRVRWEIIIATGKAIVEKYGKPEELNFTNLLRIARIKWVSDGRFPDYTRLELLKKLELENEIVVRETILTLLAEIPAHEITASHFVYEEKEIQRITNEFNLYAYDPVKYAAYEASKSLFERLWKDKKILDAPAKAYLKNDQAQWTTMVNKPVDKKDAASKQANISLSEYFNEVPEEPASRKGIKMWVGFFISILFLISFLGLIFLTILNFTNTIRLAVFTYKKPVQQKVSFILKDSSNTATTNEISIRIDTTEIRLLKDSTVSTMLSFNDSVKRIFVSVNNEQVFNSPMKFDQDGYAVLVKAASVEKNIWATFYLMKACGDAVDSYNNIISGVNKNIIVSDSMVSQRVVSTNATACINKISYGIRVDTATVNNVRAAFRKTGIELTVAPVSFYPVGDHELAIYYAGENGIKDDVKPEILIMISDESLRASATAFKTSLNAAGYIVGNVTLSNFSSNSQVEYYKKELNNQALAIQQLYRKFYPQLPIPVQLITDTRNSGVSDFISVMIRKLDDDLPLKLNSTGQKVFKLQEMLIKTGFTTVTQNSRFDQATLAAVKQFQVNSRLIPDGIVGPQVWAVLSDSALLKFAPRENKTPDTTSFSQQNTAVQQQTTTGNTSSAIADIATKQIGYTENPAGSNKTKYGQWYGIDGLPWAGIFVSWVYNQAGKPLEKIESSMGFASFERALKYFSNQKSMTQRPVPGDIVIVANGSRYTGGIFIKWVDPSQTQYESVEGNTLVDGKSIANGVSKQVREYNPKTTYFIHPAETQYQAK